MFELQLKIEIVMEKETLKVQRNTADSDVYWKREVYKRQQLTNKDTNEPKRT